MMYVTFFLHVVGQRTRFLRSDMFLLWVTSMLLMWTAWNAVAENGVLLAFRVATR